MRKIIFILFISILSPLKSQISHGGSPLFLFPFQQNNLKSASVGKDSFFIEMPTFNLDSLLEDDKLNESNMRGAFRFAHKFYTTIERGKSGQDFTLSNGTKVWQVGIRSAGAFSINVFFSEFELPEGGKLFLYSADKSHILGSFTHQNNSEEKILPVSPVIGDEIIIEYSEPDNVTFPGKLKISEVNHDYRGILQGYADINYDCMPDVMCTIPDSKEKNSVVRLLINGDALCTGTLINNLNNNGTPYLLTATHCLNGNSTKPQNMIFFQQRAGTVVVLFNYQRPACGSFLPAPQNMTISGSKAVCIIQRNDVALLKLNTSPPTEYNPFYAGWNINTSTMAPPYSNIHHPAGILKRYGKCNKNISLTNYNWSPGDFSLNSFWQIPGWDVGSTLGGSSGSPLFDSNNLIVGGLTGGMSECSGSNPNGIYDYFFALHKSWEYSTSNDSLQLKHWLDPEGTDIKSCIGFDPYGNSNLDKNKPENSTSLSYNPATGEITLHATPEEKGYIHIYSTSGLKVYQQNYQGSKTFSIPICLKNSVGIVFLVSDKKNETLKVVF